jgi:phosphoglycerate dehydrogenase-like enzyme
VCFLGTGYQAFLELPDVPSETSFTFTPYANAEAVAELTVALTLDRIRLVSTRAAEVVDGEWSEKVTGSLIGARIGVAGMGHIGRAVSRMVTGGFGAGVVYWNRTPRPELQEASYVAAASLLDLCRQVDVLILSLAYIPGETDGIVGERELAALGEGSVVVNSAAARLVQPAAMRDALMSGQVSAAAFDGYYQEPTPRVQDDPHGLLSPYPRFLVTPHCGSLTHGAMQRMADMATANVLAVLAGEVPPHAIPVDLAAQAGPPLTGRTG